MEFLVWERELYTHIDRVDQEHMKVVDSLNQLHRDWKSGAVPQESLLALMDRTTDILDAHFQDEIIRQRYGLQYPKWDLHEKVHIKFIQKFRTLQQEIHNNLRPLEDYLNEMKRWFTMHVSVHDQGYVRYMKANNIDPSAYENLKRP